MARFQLIQPPSMLPGISLPHIPECLLSSPFTIVQCRFGSTDSMIVALLESAAACGLLFMSSFNGIYREFHSSRVADVYR